MESDIMDAVHALTALITLANIVTAMTPTKVDDEILNFGLRVLNAIALNVGKNRNADS